MPAHFLILHYPGASRAAIEGLREMFQHTARLCERDALPALTHAVATPETLPQTLPTAAILPPAFGNSHYLTPDPAICAWLTLARAQNRTLASACAGAFYLGACGALDHRRATTHWALGAELQTHAPLATIDTGEILIAESGVITAGGLLSWVDLALELVAGHAGLETMRELGRHFVVDTGRREQRPYRGFTPRTGHDDAPVLLAQDLIRKTYTSPVRIARLADAVGLTERTFLRRFERATGLTPLTYVQHLRMHSAQLSLENTPAPIEQISYAVGYENPNAFRKLFKRHTGLSPTQYRQRLKR
jgi:transcriptional regulator GlxA family with amidase domain